MVGLASLGLWSSLPLIGSVLGLSLIGSVLGLSPPLMVDPAHDHGGNGNFSDGFESLLYERVRYVAHNASTNKYIFRGNLPLSNWYTFAHGPLLDFIARRAAEAHVEIGGPPPPAPPAPPYLIDWSFLHQSLAAFPKETVALHLENIFFGENPGLGHLVWTEITGDTLDPFTASPATRAAVLARLRDDQPDELIEHVESIARWLGTAESPDAASAGAADGGPRRAAGAGLSAALAAGAPRAAGRPIVLYMHCVHGQDRTGEVAGALALGLLGQSWADVLAYNTALGMDVPENIWALKWYDLWLEAQGKAPGAVTGPASGAKQDL